MKLVLSYCLLSCVLLLSCDSRGALKREYEQITSDTISLCLNQMLAVSYNGDDIPQVKSNCMSNSAKKMVVFADSSICTSCYIKQMPGWYNLIDSVKRKYGNSVEFCFVISSKKHELGDVLKTFEFVSFDYPSFVDTSNVFRRKNMIIPDNHLFHSFLLDESNKVVMVGNPQQNVKVRDIFFRCLEGKCSKE